MKQLKIRILLIVIFLISTIFILTFNLFAQEREKKRGDQGHIKYEKMRSKFSKGGAVEGYVIEGEDIIEIIKRTDYIIRIKDSIIEGGLDFAKSAVPLEKENLPKDWNEKEKEAFIEKWSYKKNIRLVKNEISIINSEIRPGEAEHPIFKNETYSYSINARNTLFLESIEFSENAFSDEADFSEAIFSDEAEFSESTFSGEVDFSGAIFNHDAYFPESTFSAAADFGGAIFSDEAEFSESTFSGEAYFEGATLCKAYFLESIFSDETNFSNATFSREAYFEGAIFNHLADFSGAIFSGEADFSEAIFSDEADFSEAIFSDEAEFSEAIFIKLAYFNRVSFFDKLNAAHAVFKEYADFRESKIRRLNFNSVNSPTIVEGRIDFRNATISEAHFQDIIFEKDVDFSDAKFGIPLNIVRLDELSQSIEIPDSLDELLKSLEFPDSIEDKIYYEDKEKLLIFTGCMTRSEKEELARLSEDSQYRKAIIQLFRESTFLDKLLKSLEFPDSIEDKIYYEDKEKLLIFTGYMTRSEKEELARLSEDSQYRKAIIQLFRESTSAINVIVFRFVKFESDAYFLRTKFSGDTALVRVTFKKEANFTDADFKSKKEDGKHNFSLSYLNFNNLLIEWGQLPNPKSWVSETRIKSFLDIYIEKEKRNKKKSKQERKDEEVDEVKKKGEEKVESGEGQPLSQVLKGLEASFRNQKQLSDANKAYYYKKNAEFKEEKNSKAFWKWFPKQTFWSLWWISCGYGTKILWILGWLIFFDLLFAMIYSVKNNLKKKTHLETKGEFTFKQRLLDFPRLYLTETKPLDMIKSKSAIKFINAFRFSSVILFKVGYRDTTISGKILGIDYKYIVWIEWLLGFYLLACLTVTMSNTVPIINRLISGMF